MNRIVEQITKMTEKVQDKETSIQRISGAINKLLKETPKKMVQLRNGLQDALNLIASYQNPGTTGKTVKLDANGVPTEPADLDKLANALVTPLKLACESHNTKMMQIALDCLHKMMDYGYIRGAAVDEETPEKKLMPKVITVISSCFDSPDDNVQLQIIKALHTAVASPICDVHETSLLNAIRCCYNICLVSRNSVNQSTAKATLTQMLHIIFSRMELQMSPDVVIGIDDSLYDLDEIEKNILKKAQLDEEPKEPKHPTIVVHQVDSSDAVPPTESPSSNSIEGVTEHISETASDEGTPNNVDHLAADNNNNTPHQNPSPTPSPMDTPRSLSRSSSAASLAEAEQHGLNGAEQLLLMKARRNDKESFVFTDCFLVFRALCKLSTKEVPKEAQNDLNSIDMKSKILSLELILHILEHSGPVFRSFDKFINTAIKKYLIISLLLNGVSSNPKVFKLSLSVFLALVSYFKDYLKNEIGVFYGKIFLVILETANSTVQQKWMVLYALLQICKNPQALVDIFVNYDCDLEHKDVFGRMVNDLSKITQGPLGVEPSSEGKLRALALECLVNINRSLLEWTKELRQTEDQTPKMEKEETPKLSTQNSETTTPTEVPNNTTDKPPTDSPYRPKATGGPDFAMTRQHKLQMSKGIEKFNENPKKGIRFLIEQGLVENNAEVIAKFFRTTEGLDKTKMGDFLGEKDDLSKAVMHSYVDLFHWHGLSIDIALRRFLETFRLPGEAQKIDRIMEKFAERYFAQNPSAEYANADAAYVLSFSIIMLSTSLHNPAIKDKMKKEQFYKQQAKLNDGKDFDKQFLSDLYDRIQAEEFKLQQTEEPKHDISADPRERKEMFQKEMERSIVKSKNLLKEKAKDRTIYYRAKQSELVKPMFEIAHEPVLSSVTVMMKESDEPEVIHLCLEGLKHSISISCTFAMESERNVLIDTLTKFTVLNNLKEMKQKNVDSIKIMIEIAKSEANYLGEAWLPILRCISQLEQLHLIGSGASVEALPTPNSMPPRDKIEKRLSFRPASFMNLGGAASSPSGHQRRPSSTMISSQEVLNANLVAEQIDSVAIDKIFTNSVSLNSTAIEDFVRALCQVSLDEIESPNPRLFSLQKLVELADFNMDRIRYVWSRLWSLLSNHFIKVGCENPEISVYAIDSLKQLAMKFLEKKELANFHFQKEFLKPFEFIMANQSNVTIRDMVIRCLSNMVLGKAQNIKSGWKSIFIAFTVAATDRDESIVRLAFDMAQEIIKKYFNLISEGFFVDLVNCLVAYGNGHLYIDISLKAITSLTFCAKQLAEGNVIPLIREESENNNEQPADKEDGIFTENDKYLGLWFPILTGLSGIVGHSHIDVRTAALTALSNVLQSYGHMFNRNFWELMFRGVLLPIFDNVSYAGGTDLFKEDNEWLTTTCLLAFNSLLALYTGFFDRISFLLNDLLNLLTNCILQENESLARIGATCFLQLVMQNGQRLTEEMWTTICTRLSSILERNTPNELLKSDSQALEVILVQNIGTSASVTQVRSVHLKSTPSSEQLDGAVNGENNNTDNNNPNSPRSQRQKIPLTAAMVSKIIRGKSTVQLGLIEALNEIAFTLYPQLSTSHLMILLDSLEACYKFTYEANYNVLYRSKIEKSGLVDLLLREETTAVSSYLRVLFRMYAETTNDSENRITISEEKLLTKLKEIIGDFVQRTADKDKSKSESKRILGAYAGIIVQILKGIHDFYEPQLKGHLQILYPMLCDLISSDSKEVRNSLKKVFVKLGQIQSITK